MWVDLRQMNSRMRTSPVFETTSEKYGWLNRIVAVVSVGSRLQVLPTKYMLCSRLLCALVILPSSPKPYPHSAVIDGSGIRGPQVMANDEFSNIVAEQLHAGIPKQEIINRLSSSRSTPILLEVAGCFAGLNNRNTPNSHAITEAFKHARSITAKSL